jgi:hypothetical protein
VTRLELEHLIRAAGTIAENSPFLNVFGYYAHGVEEKTAILPDGWRDRLILVTGENTRNVRGWCLEVHDLAIAKLAAGRDKDLDFTAALIRHGMIRRDVLEDRLSATPVDPGTRARVSQRIARQFSDAHS